MWSSPILCSLLQRGSNPHERDTSQPCGGCLENLKKQAEKYRREHQGQPARGVCSAIEHPGSKVSLIREKEGALVIRDLGGGPWGLFRGYRGYLGV